MLYILSPNRKAYRVAGACKLYPYVVPLQDRPQQAGSVKYILSFIPCLQSDELEALKQQVLEGEGELKDLQRKESKQTAAGNAIHQDMKRLEGALEALALKQTEILKNAQLEQVWLSFGD